ncbi:MAG: methylated-DNA--[protein]-cysteine S-methyltransferase [Bacteroidetes bacterium]|nr:methylated-DNA--[protein]-cysteine S-methyltransferase [Bacteroidota bacterium]
METLNYNSPIGNIQITLSDKGINRLIFADKKARRRSEPGLFSAEYMRQLDAYFNGQLKQFNIPLDLQGSEFQLKVWRELQKIPFGQTISYMELARRLGKPKAIRAAAHANAKNPVSIIVPCHRVIGSNGNLIGYAGGLWRKKWLLELEMYGTQQKLF